MKPLGRALANPSLSHIGAKRGTRNCSEMVSKAVREPFQGSQISAVAIPGLSMMVLKNQYLHITLILVSDLIGTLVS